jgi:lipopolysaccharide biosynthesis protein
MAASPAHKVYSVQKKPTPLRLRDIWFLRREFRKNLLFVFLDFFFPKRTSDREILNFGERQNTRHLLIYAHYSSDGSVAEYVLEALKSYLDTGAYVVFITTSAMDTVHENFPAHAVILRQNIGYDIGSYAVAWQEICQRFDVKRFSRVTFTNDTVIGPLYPIQNFFQRMDESNYDIMGMTDSYVFHYHVQSYFISVKLQPETIDFLNRTFADFKFYQHQFLLIFQYEIGITRLALYEGFRIGAFAPYRRLQDHVCQTLEDLGYASSWLDKPRDPTLHFWYTLTEKLKMPFIKWSLLLYNPCKVPDLKRLEQVCATTGYSYDLVSKHRKRSNGPRVDV